MKWRKFLMNSAPNCEIWIFTGALNCWRMQEFVWLVEANS